MDAKIIEKLDKSDMRSMLKGFPQQFTHAVELFPEDLQFPKVEGAIVCGMGGSSLPADIVNALWIEHTRLEISREYFLPVWVNEKTLAFVCSFSGNTEETISAYHQAHERNMPVCVITRGGKLAEMAKEWNDPLLLIDESRPTFQPRFASGFFYAFITLAMQRAGLIDADIAEHLQQVSDALAKFDPEDEAKQIASRLKGRIPLVYSSGCFVDSVARIWKIKFNENSKIPSFYNAIPELNHNEMVGFTNTLSAPLHVLMLRDSNEYERISVRFEALKELLSKLGIEHSEVWFEGSSDAEKIFRMLYLGDFVTYYLALELGYDPTPVEIVESFKAAIRR